MHVARRRFPALLVVLAGAAPLLAQSPYAGMQERAIKALSDEEVKAYVRGEGMGLAMAAELNGYPGPRHVLELAEPLGLDRDQIGRTRAVFDDMDSQARALGIEIVDLEKQLDQRFADGSIETESLVRLVSTLAERAGRLRIAHLDAHLRMMEILTEEQVARYAELRGYGGGGHDPSGHPHHPGAAEATGRSEGTSPSDG